MSNPYVAPDHEVGADPALARKRPASATVWGILNLVFGIMGICGGIFTGLMFAALAIPELAEAMQEAEGMEIFQNSNYRAFLVVATIVNMFLTILLIISGIGLLKFKPWGRTAAIWYAIPQIFSIIVAGIAQYYFVIMPAIQNAPPGAQGVGAISGAIGGLVGQVFGLLFPCLLLYFMNRRQFVAQITAQK